MREVEFRRLLDDQNGLRVKINLEHGQVIGFVVQYEAQFAAGEKWLPVVRYDTAHGFAHRDELHPSGSTVKVRLDTDDYNYALDRAMADLNENWTAYRQRYERWLRTQ